MLREVGMHYLKQTRPGSLHSPRAKGSSQNYLDFRLWIQIPNDRGVRLRSGWYKGGKVMW